MRGTGRSGRAGGRALGAAAGVVADLLLGEPPAGAHPVAGFGALMTRVEGALYRDRRGPGVLHALTGLAAGAGSGAVLSRLGGPPGATALSTSVAVAHRQLAAEARAVGAALDRGDLAGARRRLPALVGRDPAGLDEKELARAVVESVAENTVDAVVAPALWAAVGGAPGALAYRAANTMDAMVGHRTPRHGRYGWAAARTDDAASYVPARITAVLVALARPRRSADVLRVVRRDAPGHPSPNAGVAEAAFAGALGVRLGGANRYGSRVEVRPALGDGPGPGPADIPRAVALARDVTLVLAGALAAAGGVGLR